MGTSAWSFPSNSDESDTDTEDDDVVERDCGRFFLIIFISLKVLHATCELNQRLLLQSRSVVDCTSREVTAFSMDDKCELAVKLIALDLK